MKLKRLGCLLATCAFGVSMLVQTAPVSAKEIGGWDEMTGYYINDTNINYISSKSTPSHTGKAETKVIDGTSAKRAVGNTTWSGVYHYTRARVEDITLGINFGVLTDSGRVWGNDKTSATSPWWKFNGDTTGSARTYYGNES